MCGSVLLHEMKRSPLTRAVPALAIAILTIAGSPSLADETPPTFDSAKYCDASVARMFPKDSAAAKVEETKKCMERETEYAASLARIWPHVWPQDQSACLASTEPSYQRVAACVSLALSKHILEPDAGPKTSPSESSLPTPPTPPTPATPPTPPEPQRAGDPEPQKVGDVERSVVAHKPHRRVSSQRLCGHLTGRNWACPRQFARGTRPLIELKWRLGRT